jgi:hypothetical protein
MIAYTRTSAIVGLLLTMAFSQSRSKASDATIDWHYIGDGPRVTQFMLTPNDPTTLSLITFVAPTDGSNYLNGCLADLKYGFPAIAVDPTNRIINVTFSGHPGACPNIVFPASGLEGHVGPLTAGIWSIRVAHSFPFPTIYSFAVELVPPPLSVQAGVGSSIRLSWPVSGELYALESTDDLVLGNWQVLTNSPTVSSDRYSLQISADSGSRFFRLHHF